MVFHQVNLGWSCRPKSNGIIDLAGLKKSIPLTILIIRVIVLSVNGKFDF